ncbi:MAG: hypothetical protein L0323_08975 [Planctomycetes bacterium]|nr:hypothetical protein [Planctomycetota bacterium]
MCPKRTSASAPFLSAACLTLLGCADAGRYLRDRALDLSDVVDPKFGLGLGAGAKAEVSDYAGAGAGIGAAGGYEFYGRRTMVGGGVFFHLGVVGADMLGEGGPPIAEGNLLLVQFKDERPPPLSRARIGGEVLAALVNIGVYVNLGEIADFFGGLVGLDPAGDDGVAKGARFEPEEPTTRPATRPGPPGRGTPTRPSNEPPGPR